MGFLDLTKSLDNLVVSQYSDASGPVIRGKHTELTLVHFDVGEDTRNLGVGQAYPSGVPQATKALERSWAISFKNLLCNPPTYKTTARTE
jgi:hypothetical protein